MLRRPVEFALRPAIGVMNEPGGELSLADRHGECLQREVLIRLFSHGPADHPPRTEIQQHRDIEPACARGHQCDVSHPDAVECRRNKLLFQQIGGRRRELMMLDTHPEASYPLRLELPGLPQSGDPMASAPNPAGLRLSPEFHSPVFLPHLPVDLTQEWE